MKPKRTPIYTDDGRVACYFNGRELVKSAVESKHMLRTPPAWAWDVAVIESGLELGAEALLIETRDTNKRYRVSMDVFLDRKGVLNRGHNLQWFLVLKHWNSDDSEQLKLV